MKTHNRLINEHWFIFAMLQLIILRLRLCLLDILEIKLIYEASRTNPNTREDHNNLNKGWCEHFISFFRGSGAFHATVVHNRGEDRNCCGLHDYCAVVVITLHVWQVGHQIHHEDYTEENIDYGGLFDFIQLAHEQTESDSVKQCNHEIALGK
jgi:hypothetical protein